MRTRNTLAIAILISAAAPALAKRPTTALEPIDPQNEPERIATALKMERDLKLLPTSGTLARPVWQGSWWPTKDGGTAARPSPDQLSPAEKFDLVSGSGGVTTAFEKEKQRVTGNLHWAGHCNGLALASIWAEEPKRAVTVKGVTFTPDDVKGLLVEAYQGAGWIVGGRCRLQDLPRDPFGRVIDPACRDLNPGSFHLALSHFIGQRKFPLIIDLGTNVEVWNYPIKAYSVGILPIDKTEATRLIGGEGDKYQHNAKAEKFARVNLTIQLVNNYTHIYGYVLEMDAQDKIIGGEWTLDTQGRAPDFVWLAGPEYKPENPGIARHQALVKQIHQRSIGQLPANDTDDQPSQSPAH